MLKLEVVLASVVAEVIGTVIIDCGTAMFHVKRCEIIADEDSENLDVVSIPEWVNETHRMQNDTYESMTLIGIGSEISWSESVTPEMLSAISGDAELYVRTENWTRNQFSTVDGFENATQPHLLNSEKYPAIAGWNVAELAQ